MSVIGNTELQFSEEQGMILDTAREFCRDKSPIAAVRAQLGSVLAYDAKTWDEMVSLGWLGIALPETCGGSQLGVSAVVPVVECMGRALLGTPFISTTLAAQLIARAGNTEQIERLLPGIIEGMPATAALLENGDWGDLQVSCSVSDDLVLHGIKKYVADAGAARLFIVSVEYRGAAALAIVSRDQ
ncbi:MAG: acyl-CoA dehydrogenase family protein, partial [Proteobacteria bacterium]|nr:acyl-CoA dehydrogenase family protein [Pseudomonadota bacterium]